MGAHRPRIQFEQYVSHAANWSDFFRIIFIFAHGTEALTIPTLFHFLLDLKLASKSLMVLFDFIELITFLQVNFIKISQISPLILILLFERQT